MSGRLVFTYDEGYRDLPFTQIEQSLREYDRVTFLRDNTLTVRFSNPQTLQCLWVLIQEGAIKSEVEIRDDNGNPVTLGRLGIPDPDLFDKTKLDWLYRIFPLAAKE